MAGHTFCTSEVQTMIPLLREVYDDSMIKVLYVGPDTCLMMSELLLDEEDYEAWGVEPYGSDASNLYCWDLIHKGIIRVADMKFSLPYREKSFSHVIISDTLEYFSSRYLNNTIPELMRVSRDGVIIFAGKPLIIVLFYRDSNFKTLELRVEYNIILMLLISNYYTSHFSLFQCYAGYPDYPLSEFTRYKFNRQVRIIEFEVCSS